MKQMSNNKNNKREQFGYQPDNNRGYQPPQYNNGYKPTITPKPAPPKGPTPSPKSK